MKKRFLTLALIGASFFAVQQAQAMVWVALFSDYMITMNSANCTPGGGICLSLNEVGDGTNGGALEVDRKTLKGSFTIDANTKGLGSYLNGNLFELKTDCPIDPEVLFSETGIKGNYQIETGSYKTEKQRNGFYKVYFKLSKL